MRVLVLLLRFAIHKTEQFAHDALSIQDELALLLSELPLYLGVKHQGHISTSGRGLRAQRSTLRILGLLYNGCIQNASKRERFFFIIILNASSDF